MAHGQLSLAASCCASSSEKATHIFSPGQPKFTQITPLISHYSLMFIIRFAFMPSICPLIQYNYLRLYVLAIYFEYRNINAFWICVIWILQQKDRIFPFNTTIPTYWSELFYGKYININGCYGPTMWIPLMIRQNLSIEWIPRSWDPSYTSS